MKAKRKGTRNEHRTMALLEAAGYYCARSGGSLALFDVVGIGTTDVVLVQCKTRDWPGTVEMESCRISRARQIAADWFTAGGIGYGCPTVKEL